MRPTHFAITSVLIAALPACAGAIAPKPSDDARDDDDGAGGGGGEPVEPGPGPSVPVPPPPASCGTVDPGFVGLRRLSRIELDHTLRDLLGETEHLALGLPKEDSVLADQTGVSALAFEKLETIADRAVDGAFAKRFGVFGACTPSAADKACGRNIVKAFARRAFRRPPTTEELAALDTIVAESQARGEDPGTGVRLAAKATLLAPEVLFRTEVDAPGAKARALSPHELATRLSYLIWSSLPDERLDRAADDGSLAKAEVVEREVARMLADPKAEAFVEGFANYWLGLPALQAVAPDATKYPTFDEPLRAAMGRETLDVFRAFLQESRPARDLLDADFTFAEAPLAKHYGLTGSGRITGLPLERRGLLTHAGILTMTSGPQRTSPVKRGKWVLKNLLCTTTPPPPPGADEPRPEAEAAATERERLAIHRADPKCAACHMLIDPIGLGLENFDGLGRHRTKYDNGAAIDPSGELAGGGAFKTFDEMRALLKSDPRVPDCFAGTLFTYAIGRAPGDGDACAQTSLVDALAAKGSVRDFVFALTKSPAFTQRRGEP